MKFVPNLSTTLSPLYTLLHSSSKWRWSTVEEKAFQTSKDLLTSAPVLIHYDPTKPLLLACDASPYGVGAVLSHQFPDVTEKPIAFASRTLTAAEQNYAQNNRKRKSCVYFWSKTFPSVFVWSSFCSYHRPQTSSRSTGWKSKYISSSHSSHSALGFNTGCL